MADVETPHAEERLSPTQIANGGLLAATHVQRYALAAELCAGLRVVDLCCGTGYGSVRLGETASAVVGVDLSEEALATARALSRDQDHVDFVRSDAADYLEGITARDVDLVACFEGVEHVPDPERLADALGRLAADGVKVLISVPNSAAFDEDNAFHVTDFDFVTAQRLAERIGADPARLDQLHGDTAILLPADERELPTDAVAVLDSHRTPDPSVATHWLFATGVEPTAFEQARLRVAITARPHHYGYMLALEEANRELWAANQRFSRAWLGVHDAAAGRAARFREELQELKKERDSLIERLESAVESARQNDQYFQATRLELLARESELRQARSSLVRRGGRYMYRRLRGRTGR